MTNPNVPDSSKTVRQSFQTHEQQSALIEQDKLNDAKLQIQVELCGDCPKKEQCPLLRDILILLEE